MKNKIEVSTLEGEVEVEYSTFPAGENHVRVVDVDKVKYTSFVYVDAVSADSDTIITLILLADALKRINKATTLQLNMDYLAYGRQDRRCREGEAFSLQVIMTLLRQSYKVITSYDVHSTVSNKFVQETTPALDRPYMSLKYYKEGSLKGFIGNADLLVAPDAGARNRVEVFSKALGIPYVNLEKHRENSKLTIIVPDYTKNALGLPYRAGGNIVVCDDICDGGGTFIVAATKIREINRYARLTLVISHAIFSKGVSILKGYYDEIIVVDDAFNNAHVGLDNA